MYIGIDFGTSYSQTATIVNGKPFLLLPPSVYGVPSVFYYDHEAGILIGEEAMSWGQGNAAQNMVEHVKMGLLNQTSYVLDSKNFIAQEIISAIIRSTLQIADEIAEQNFMDCGIEGAVVSIPAKFSLKERALIRDAVSVCLPQNIPLRIIREPVAAALSYKQVLNPVSQYTLVFDLGGGTCDVAIVQKDPWTPELYHVKSCEMARIGGRDWDSALALHIAKVIENMSKESIQNDEKYMRKIYQTARQVKHDLSHYGKKKAIAAVEIKGQEYRTIITQEIFEEVTLYLLNDAIECVKRTMDSFPCEIDEIICVGGSSNMPQVKKRLESEFPSVPIHLFTPEHAVVNGAAFYAADLKINEILHFSYGINTSVSKERRDQEQISNILIKGAPITADKPVVKSKCFRPASNEMSEIRFGVYESECTEERYDPTSEDCLLIGEVAVKLPTNITADTNIFCHFKITIDGILEVTAETDDHTALVVKNFQLAEI